MSQIDTNADNLQQPDSRTPETNFLTQQVFQNAMREISKIFVGQEELVTVSLVALFSGGHVLIEGVPGLGKTLFVRTLGHVLGCQFGRIQFTADLMPSDITGAPILDLKTQDFRFRPGPVFTQFLLADEINRSPAKTHAALLEIMQEFRVTIDGVSHPVPRPFLVMATQNPIESEGTYSLPEAQLDRFMFKAVVSYPDEPEEARILELHSQQVDLGSILKSQVQQVTTAETIQKMVQLNAQVRVEPKLLTYINRIVRATRNWPTFHMGASPRAGLAISWSIRNSLPCCVVSRFRGYNCCGNEHKRNNIQRISLRFRRFLSILGTVARAHSLFATDLNSGGRLENLSDPTLAVDIASVDIFDDAHCPVAIGQISDCRYRPWRTGLRRDRSAHDHAPQRIAHRTSDAAKCILGWCA